MNSFSDLIIPIAIGLIMYGIGISLKFKDFTRVFLKPKAILTGLACQLFLLPAFAFAMIYFWPIDPIYKVGVILIASAPGGTASNLVTHMLRGRVALSVSLTSFNSFAILFTIPLFVSLALRLFLGKETEVAIDFGDTFREILLTVVLPVIGGIVTNEYGSDELTERLRKPLRYILPTLLLTVFLLALFLGEDKQAVDLLANLDLFLPLFLFNILTMTVGYFVARFMGIRHSGRYTIAVEMGLQNSALAIFIATSVLHNREMATVAVIYTSFTFISTWFYAWLMKHYWHEEPEEG